MYLGRQCVRLRYKEKITTDLLKGIILILWTHTINDDFMSFQWTPNHFFCLLTDNKHCCFLFCVYSFMEIVLKYKQIFLSNYEI